MTPRQSRAHRRTSEAFKGGRVIAEDLAALAVPLDKLSLLPGNPRRGDVEAITRSLEAFGQRKPVVAKRDGTVVAGNHTLLAAQRLGWDALAVVWVDDDEATARAFALADNRTAELGGYDEAELLALIEQVGSVDAELLVAAGWLPDAVAALEASLADQTPPVGLTDPDEVPEPPAVPVTRPGDLWLLGPHRLLCGDATDPASLAHMVNGERPGALLIDPPYGIDLDTDYSSMTSRLTKTLGDGTRGNTYRPVQGDDQPFDAAPIASYFADVREQFWFGADYYRRTLSPDDRDGSWLVWDKRNESSDAGYGSGFELIWSRQRHKRDLLRHYYFGAFGPDARGRVHPTQKPVPLLSEILERWPATGCLIADPYAGSGSTLIAAHQTRRRAALLEIDPAYCDVIARRFQEHIGTKPVLEATGEPYDFTREVDVAEPAEAGRA